MNNPTEDEKKALAKERKRAWWREYRQRPEVKEKRREHQRKYAQRPEVKEKRREHQRTPEVKERVKERVRKWGQREDVRHRRLERTRRDEVRERLRDRKYGLAPGQLDAVFEATRGLCPVCLRKMIKPSGKRVCAQTAATDHDHDTGRFRGILCHRCNAKLSRSWFTIGNLQRALMYKKRTGQDDEPPQGTLL